MTKLKIKKKNNIFSKEQEVKEITLFLKSLMDKSSYKLFVKLGETDGNHIPDLNQIIKEAQLVKNIKDKNKKIKLQMMLEHNINVYLTNVSENIITKKPILNFIRLFMVNTILCQYIGVPNKLYEKCKELNLEDDFKSIYHIFCKKINDFLDYDTCFPNEIIKEMTEINENLTTCLANLIKYNQKIFNIDKTKVIINEINEEIEQSLKEIYFEKDGMLHSPQDTKLILFALYHLEQIDELTVDCYNQDENETSETLNNISFLKENIKMVKEFLKTICKLINGK